MALTAMHAAPPSTDTETATDPADSGNPTPSTALLPTGLSPTDLPPTGPASGPLIASSRFLLSPTLAANEAMASRQRRGEAVLPLAFGEAGLPVHPALRRALSEAAGRNGYGPVAGLTELREAAAGYWSRRGLPTHPDAVICGPGSKALLFGLVLAIGADVAVPQPSWVSYAAQVNLTGTTAQFVPVPPGQGGVPDADLLADAATRARASGRRIRAVVVTLPDNPTGRLATPEAVRALCEVAAAQNMIIISDEIYRDLVHDPGTPFVSPAAFAPERTIVTTALSKSLALGGWRIGVARLPDGALPDGALPGRNTRADGTSGPGTLRHTLRDRLLGIGSEIWSAPSGPIQQAAAFAFREPPELTEHIALSRRLHASVARAIAARFAAAGAIVPQPQAAFYVYPDFEPARDLLRRRHGVTTAEALAALLLRRYGMGVLPGSAFGEDSQALRLRIATSQLYGQHDWQRELALNSAAPLCLPWIASALTRIDDVLTDLTG